MLGRDELLCVLEKLNIVYASMSHPPLLTVEDARKYASHIPGAHCKNLFLKCASDKFYLVVVLDTKRVGLKDLSQRFSQKRLSFASPRMLEEVLGVKQGCVSPFALINATDKKVSVILDVDILRESEASFHPLINTETLTIKTEDLLKFIRHCEQEVSVLDATE